MSKEQWFREFERQLANGVPYHEAGERARQVQRERGGILDRADEARQRAKEKSDAD